MEEETNKIFKYIAALVVDFLKFISFILKWIIKALLPIIIIFSISYFLIYFSLGLNFWKISSLNLEGFLLVLSGLVIATCFFTRHTIDLFRRYFNTRRINKIGFLFLDYLILICLIYIYWLVVEYCLLVNWRYFTIFSKAVIIIIPALFIVLAILSLLLKEKPLQRGNMNNGGLEPDTEIQFDEDDTLGRKTFIQNLFVEISKLEFEDPFVYGLFGGWGDGKSSTLNILKNKFLKEDKNLLFVFDAWNYSDEKTMIKAFYDGVNKTIANRYILPNFTQDIRRYSNILLSGIAKSKNFNIDLNEDEKLEAVKLKLEKTLKTIGKKLIIIIDDIDRLEKHEMLSIFKQIGLNFKLKNTIFILSLDIDVVKTVLSKNCDDLDRSIYYGYVDKVIQKQLPLPPIELKHMSNFIETKIKDYFSSVITDEAEKQLLINDLNARRNIINEIVYVKADNLRRARILLNAIKTEFGMYKGRVNASDFVLVQILKIYYLSIWKGLSNQKNRLISMDNNWIQSLVKRKCGDSANEPAENNRVANLIIKTLFPYLDNQAIKNNADQMKTYLDQKRILHQNVIDEYFKIT